LAVNAIDKAPIYEKQVQTILDGLAAGRTKEELAEQLGYTNVKSLDNYMRRKNFSWDGRRGIFFPTVKKLAAKKLQLPKQDYSKAGVVVDLFAGGLDSKEIAQKLGFPSHKDLAQYMTDKDYIWDAEHCNYVKTNVKQLKQKQQSPEPNPVADAAAANSESQNSDDLTELLSFLPLLRQLQARKERLGELLESIPLDSAQLPHYAIPGTPVTKSVYMVNTIDKLVKEYSEERNVSQRQIFELALLEFFKKYGYRAEVDRLLLN